MLTKKFCMKSKILQFITNIGYIWSFIYTQYLKNKIQIVHSTFYYGWIKRHFKYIGKVYFSLPVYIGGAQYIEINNCTNIGKRVMLKTTSKYGDQIFTP